MQRVLAGSIAVVLAIGPGFASADRVGLVIRVPDAAPSITAEVTAAVARAGERLGDEIVRAPFAEARGALKHGAVRRQRLIGFRRTSELLSEGVRAYQSGDLEFALGRLAEARRVAIEVADLPGGLELVAEISLRLGAARLDLGQARAVRDLALAARLAPQRQVTLAEFKPAVVAAYQRAQAPPGKRVNLTVEVAGSSASVFMDGKAMAAAPWTDAVDVGLHLIVASAPGARPSASLVDLEGPRTVSLTLEPDRLRAAIAQGRGALAVATSESAAAVAVDGLLTFADLDAVIIASSVWRRGSAALIAERCTNGQGCGRSVEIRYSSADGLSAAAAELWRRLSETPGKLRPGLLADARLVTPEGPGGGGSQTHSTWVENPYVWLGAATGALAVAVTVLLLRNDDRQPVIHVGDELFPER